MKNCDSMGYENLNRRPPDSLHHLALERVVQLAMRTRRHIQTGTKMDWRGWPFNCIPNIDTKAYRRHGIRQLQNYLTSAPHLFNEIVLEMYRRDPASVEVILHRYLRVLEVNSKSLNLVLENAYNLNKLTTLYLFFDINRHVELVPKFLCFVGGLSNLTHLKISNCCNDHLLGVIGTNCRQLEVLDAEEDSEMTATDHGLAFLANCSKLVKFILNDAGDEYDYEDRYFGITGKGIANLIISLPRLKLLICEPYLLREAIRFVHAINVNAYTYRLQYLHARFPDRDFLMCAGALCPDIKELLIEDQVRDCAEALSRFTSLESLELQNYSWNDRDEKYYKACFENLTRLVLKNPKQIGIDPEFVEKIGKWCRSLRSLAVTLYHRDMFSRVHRFPDPFFPKLDTLVIDGDVSLNLIESLLVSTKPTSLTIYIHQLGIPSGAFDVLMLRMARDGRLASLVELRCFQWEVSLETMLFIIDNCPRLRHIWGLDLLMLSPQSISAIQEHILNNNRYINLHDGMAASERASKGIPFLSERSKHRVESAENGSEDEATRAEEKMFEDILRDLCIL